MIQTRAFTLVELSIVLVIIGLIAGGVLVGKDLLFAAKTRNQIKQIEDFSTAAVTFRLKYNCLPGDCKTATQFGLGTGSNANGNGDAMVNFPCALNSHHQWGGGNREADNFFYHLKLAGLVEGDFSQWSGLQGAGVVYDTQEEYESHFPEGKAPAYHKLHVMPSYLAGPNSNYATCGQGDSRIRSVGNSFIIQHRNPSNGHLVGAVDIIATSNIDAKIDDGLPYSGNVGVAGAGPSYNSILASSYGANCGASPNVYASTNPTSGGFTGCRLVFANRF